MIISKDHAWELHRSIVDFSERNMLFLGSHFSPEKNSHILRLPWSTVFTTIQDEHKLGQLLRLLETDDRKVTHIHKSDALSEYTRLCGSNSSQDKRDLKVITIFEPSQAEETATSMIIERRNRQEATKILNHYAVNMLKNYGRFFFLGFDINDPLKPDDLLGCLVEITDARQGDECIYFFDVMDELGELLNDFSEDSGIAHTPSSLEDFLKPHLDEADEDSIQDEDFYRFEKSSDIRFYADGHTVFIPRKEIKEIRPFAELLDFKKLTPEPKERYRYRLWFASFLNNDSLLPKWFGYKENFVLKRPFHDELINFVRKSLKNPGVSNHRPILLHGQSGSGKTVAMGLLAYTIFHEKQFPVIYITDPNVSFFDDTQNDNPHFNKLVSFLQYIQNNTKAKSVLLIWDCSGLDKERNDYIRLYRQLRNFGLNVVLVGTSYQLVGNENDPKSDTILSQKTELSPFLDILADVKLEDKDISSLDILLKKKARMDEDERKFVIDHLRKDMERNDGEEMNFLAMLYYVFWDIRDNLSHGVQKEFMETMNKLREYKPDPNSGYFGQIALKNYETYQKLVTEHYTTERLRELIEDFTKITAIFTYYNKEISLDVVYNLLGTNLETLRYVLDAPIFSEQVYSNRISYRIRTKFEARLLLKSYNIDIQNDYRSIAEYICMILYRIESQFFNSSSESEIIESITRIISMIGPNSNPLNDTRWDDYDFCYLAPCFITALHLACIAVQDDPRLMVQELSLSREYCRYAHNTPEFNPLSYKEYFHFFMKIRKAEWKAEGVEKVDWDKFESDEEKDADYLDELADELGIPSFDEYVPDLKEKLSIGEEFLEKNERLEQGRMVYFDQIKVDIANGLLTLGDDDSLKKAISQCERIVTSNMTGHAVVVWMKAHNKWAQRNDTENEVLIEKILSFAVNALQYNPEISNDRYFVREYFEALEMNTRNIGNRTLAELVSSMHCSHPTPAIIFCWVYSKLKQKEVIVCEDNRIIWNDVKGHENLKAEIDELLKVMNENADMIEVDSRCAYLRLQLYWLRHTGKPLNYKDEKQYVAMKLDEWKQVEKLCSGIITASGNSSSSMYTNHCKYVRALALIQMEQYDLAKALLREIKDDLVYMKHITKHIICDENGKPKKFSGNDVRLYDHDRSGGRVDVYTGTGKVLKEVYFNRFNITANTAQTIENGSRLEDLMMGIGFMGFSVLRWQDAKEG